MMMMIVAMVMVMAIGIVMMLIDQSARPMSPDRVRAPVPRPMPWTYSIVAIGWLFCCERSAGCMHIASGGCLHPLADSIRNDPPCL